MQAASALRRKGAPYSGGAQCAQWRFLPETGAVEIPPNHCAGPIALNRRNGYLTAPGARATPFFGDFRPSIARDIPTRRPCRRRGRSGFGSMSRVTVGASPSGKASVFGIDIPRFESWRPSQYPHDNRRRSAPFGARRVHHKIPGEKFLVCNGRVVLLQTN